MNLYILDANPIIAAKYHCDGHVADQLKVVCNILSAAHHLCPNENYDLISSHLYKSNHLTNCFVMWVIEHMNNYIWLCNMANELSRECVRRFKYVHPSVKVLNILYSYAPALPECYIAADVTSFPIKRLPNNSRIEFTNGHFVVNEFGLLKKRSPENMKWFIDVVSSYRQYYRTEKRHFANWHRNSSVPTWFI